MDQNFSAILDELRTCPPQERRAKIQALAAHSDEPLPVKQMSDAENNLVAELRAEINQLVAEDAFANDGTIQANIAAIRRLEGR